VGRARSVSVVGLLTLLFLLQHGALVWPDDFVEFSKWGRIDWGNGVVEADGVGSPPPHPENKAQARAMARARAVERARNNLLLTVRGIRISGKTTVGDILEKANKPEKVNIHTYVRTAEVVDILFRPDGHVEATVAMWLSPEFLDAVLPMEIKVIRQVRQPTHNHKTLQDGFSGIVVDCKGIRVLPCLIPRIVDEKGSVVYGPAYISREHAIKRRVAAYVKGTKAALDLDRIGGNPLVLKAIRTKDHDPTVVVISNSDARKILDNPLNLKLLHNCRVAFVLD